MTGTPSVDLLVGVDRERFTAWCRSNWVVEVYLPVESLGAPGNLVDVRVVHDDGAGIPLRGFLEIQDEVRARYGRIVNLDSYRAYETMLEGESRSSGGGSLS